MIVSGVLAAHALRSLESFDAAVLPGHRLHTANRRAHSSDTKVCDSHPHQCDTHFKGNSQIVPRGNCRIPKTKTTTTTLDNYAVTHKGKRVGCIGKGPQLGQGSLSNLRADSRFSCHVEWTMNPQNRLSGYWEKGLSATTYSILKKALPYPPQPWHDQSHVDKAADFDHT